MERENARPVFTQQNTILQYFSSASQVLADEQVSESVKNDAENPATVVSDVTTVLEDKRTPEKQRPSLVDRRVHKYSKKSKFVLTYHTTGYLPPNYDLKMYNLCSRAPIEFSRSFINNLNSSELHRIEINRKRIYAGAAQFDSEGCLLAVGDSLGTIDVYDFDFVLSKWLATGNRSTNDMGAESCSCTGRKYYLCDPAEALLNDNKHLDPDQVHREGTNWFRPIGLKHDPVLSLQLQNFPVHGIKWNPIARNEIALCSRSKNQLKIYDLEVSQKPARTLRNLSEYRGLNDITYLSSGRSSIVGATQDGHLVQCDIRAKKMTGRVRLDPSANGHTVRRAAVSVHVSACNNLLYSCNEGGDVFVHDIRRTAKELLTRNIFNSLPLKWERVERLRKLGVSGAQFHRNTSSTLSFQTLDYSVGTIDVVTGHSSGVFTPNQHLAEGQSYFAAPPVPQLIARESAASNVLCHGSYAGRLQCSAANVLSPHEPQLLMNTNVGAQVTSIACHPDEPYMVCGTIGNHLVCVTDDTLPRICGSNCSFA